jgi:putative endopeptidase
MVKQAEEHEVLGIKLKGKLTAGENLADLGGLRLSLRALKKKMGDEPLTGPNAKLVDGFNPLQRFFLSWATVWRQNIKDERAKQLVTIDPHGPNDFRANGPLRNMEEFYEAFDVKETDPMFKPKEERVDVW